MDCCNLTQWQKVILINYGTVTNESIAKILNTTVDNVIYNAIKLGLSKTKFNPDWLKKGFVTIIRNNWDLLSLQEICVLLGYSMRELESTLKEYDFLDIKLGEKPKTDSVAYFELSEEQEEYTAKIKELITINYVEEKVKPFDFFNEYTSASFNNDLEFIIKNRFTSSYCASYSGALLDDKLSDYSEEYLKMLSSTGTNGIWLSDTLRNLAEFPFDSSYSTDYQIRIKNLRKLTERCAKFGINVYLYINEPRSLPNEFYEKYPHLKGQLADDGTYCLCTSNKEVLDYLYTAVKSVAENVPLLKAVMTITMSENPTHCYSRRWGNSKHLHTDCSNCKDRRIEEIVADINNTICRALKDGNGKTKLIANMWGWYDFIDISGENAVERCVDLLDNDIELLFVSEAKKQFVRGGVQSIIGDYSISVVGPSDLARKLLGYAKAKGHKTWAKVQFNNSWECSAVPYIPVFDLMVEHVENVKGLGVEGLMTGWSLGGYPGGALPLLNACCAKEKVDLNKWYSEVYGDNYLTVQKAINVFSKAFTNFPFSVDSIYFAGHNLGCGNVWSLEKQNRESTMVCFSFDDYDKYTKPYGIDVYIKLLSNLTSQWEKGLELLNKETGNKAYQELLDCALTAYAHFKSSLNLCLFSKYKVDVIKNREILLNCIESERELTKLTYELICRDAKIGFEMTNHYYYNYNSLMYKLINLESCEYKIKNLN